jgi:SNF2 family DNA or RNA helicase
MEAAIEFGLARHGAGIMLDPGMGKTGITYAIITVLKAQNEIRRVLVVAPLRVAKATWPAEASKWEDFSHLRVATACELDPVGRERIAGDNRIDVVTINPESLHKLLEHKDFDRWGFDLLVIDESTKFKDTTTMRFKALKKKIASFKRRLILTGTPVPNGLQDLFGQMYIVDFGASLGKFITHFRMHYMYQRPGDLYSYYIRPGAEEVIYEKVKPSLMRLKAKDHLEMPELINNIIEIDLPEKVMKQYKELDDDFITTVEEQQVAVFNTAALGTKLRQFANGFLYFEDPENPEAGRQTIHIHDAKLDALQELVESMQGRPLLLGYEFQADADRIMARFPGAVNLGKAKDSAKVINDFNYGLIPLLLGHPASVGHGLNLQELCHDVAWYGDPWDLELYLQFIARVWRQGQPAPFVTVHHLVARGTRDLKVAAALAIKDLNQEKFNAAILAAL